MRQTDIVDRSDIFKRGTFYLSRERGSGSRRKIKEGKENIIQIAFLALF